VEAEDLGTPRAREVSYSANTRINTGDLWRRRVEVESTIRPAKDRIAGFEGREGHRTPFASVVSKVFTLQGLHPVSKFGFRSFLLRCYWGVG
jgi:hypothetical protein